MSKTNQRILFAWAALAILWGIYDIVRDGVPVAMGLWNDEVMAASSPILQVWLMIMGLTIVLSILFVVKYWPARILFLGLLAVFLVAPVITEQLGLTSYAGLVSTFHILFWGPGFVMLLADRDNAPLEARFSFPALYAAWLHLALFVVGVSLFLDLRDTVVYLAWAVGVPGIETAIP